MTRSELILAARLLRKMVGNIDMNSEDMTMLADTSDSIMALANSMGENETITDAQ